LQTKQSQASSSNDKNANICKIVSSLKQSKPRCGFPAEYCKNSSCRFAWSEIFVLRQRTLVTASRQFNPTATAKSPSSKKNPSRFEEIHQFVFHFAHGSCPVIAGRRENPKIHFPFVQADAVQNEEKIRQRRVLVLFFWSSLQQYCCAKVLIRNW
jgi:hypothetical protein